jgi:hypothetical protein
MIRLKRPASLYVLLLLALLPWVLFNAPAEFSQGARDAGVLLSPGAGEKASESGGPAHLVSENPLFYSQLPAQSRTPPHRLWRQLVALAVCALLLKSFSKLTLRKYCFHHYFPREFFRSLVLSLLLGGRAPPSSAY